jgi:hypothetical protein
MVLMGGVAVPDLEGRIGAVVGQLNVLHAELVELVAEAVDTSAWAGVGIRSVAHWVSWKAGVSPAHAAELVALAAAGATHPAIMGAFADGELTVDQAAMAIKVPSHNDAEVARLAKLSTVTQLRTIVRCARPAPTAKPPETPAESVSTWTDDDGRVHGRFALDADHGAIFNSALAAARDRLFRDGCTAVTWVEALLDVCQRSLDSEDAARRERFRINVFLDPTKPLAASWQDGFSVPDAIRRHLDCDGLLTPTFVAGGRPVSVGTTMRIVPDRTRRLVLQRDCKCRVPWCNRTRGLQVHHVVHWEDGGGTDPANLAGICPPCHRLHHQGEIGITGNADEPDGLIFTDRHGRPLAAAPRIDAPTMPPPPPKRPYHHPLGERLETRWLWLSHPPKDPPPSQAARAVHRPASKSSRGEARAGLGLPPDWAVVGRA